MAFLITSAPPAAVPATAHVPNQLSAVNVFGLTIVTTSYLSISSGVIASVGVGLVAPGLPVNLSPGWLFLNPLIFLNH